MTEAQKELYTKTKERLRRIGKEDPAEVILYLAEENERLRSRHTVDEGFEFCNLVGDALIYTKTLEDYNKLRADFRVATARKIFEEIKKCRVVGVYGIEGYLKADIDELGKIYTEGGRCAKS